MPYRAMIYALGTLIFAAGVLLMWLYALTPMVTRSDNAETRAAATATTGPAQQARDDAHQLGHPNQALHKVVRGVMWLAIMLLTLLVAVGVFATFREWALRKSRPARKKMRTKYVDAWKLAAERMKPPPPTDPDAPPPPESL